jgi:hypothetical protein
MGMSEAIILEKCTRSCSKRLASPSTTVRGVAVAHRLAVVAHQATTRAGRVAGLAQKGLGLAFPARYLLGQVAHQDALDQGLGTAFQIPAQRHQAGALPDHQETLDHVGHGHLAEGLEGIVAGLARDQGRHAARHLGGAVEAVQGVDAGGVLRKGGVEVDEALRVSGQAAGALGGMT